MLIINENFKLKPKYNWYSKILRKYWKIRISLSKPAEPIPDDRIAEKVEKWKKLTIQVTTGGLGDHLSYSSLPELLYKQKGIKTSISEQSVFRSTAIRDFVWGLNPYVAFTNQKGWFTNQAVENNYLTMDEYFQNLFDIKDDGLPKVYYLPQRIEQLTGKTIVDPSFGPSGKANGYFEPVFQERFIEHLKEMVDGFVLIVHQHSKVKNKLEEEVRKTFNPPCYPVRTIEELADTLYSAKERFLVYSGAASLAAALRLPSTVLCNRKSQPYFQYKINRYINLPQQKNGDEERNWPETEHKRHKNIAEKIVWSGRQLC